ncbi:MAG: NAD-dependent epimerase/dehydratase family protein, partial [Verrucomicrobia bacterium]|nr:NAD-dependent epimerase/dehydratase family protein [Verrucomicrobiota bacterium]
RTLLEHRAGLQIVGIDNLSRRGSETNVGLLKGLGCEVVIDDLRDPAVLERQARADWLIDAAADPSVLAGLSGSSPATELLRTNLFSTVPMLEFCRRHGAAFTLLSTSRVYSIQALLKIPLTLGNSSFEPQTGSGCEKGVGESFSCQPPLSLYGASKFCAETLALEYGSAFGFPVWINRCGVLAGAGQFGKADQGIFSFWIHRWAAKKPLKYIGFGGHGHQVRDCLHPADLAPLLLKQFEWGMAPGKPRLINVSGGIESATSLRQLSEWCTARLGPLAVQADSEDRPFDLPWMVLNSGLARAAWDWEPARSTACIFEEIAAHAISRPGWLDLCGA